MSDSPLVGSGFARVTREVVRRLNRVDGVQVACLGWSHDGWPHSPQAFDSIIYPAPQDDFGRSSLQRAVDDFRPDVVVTLGELWMLDWLPSHPARSRFRWVAYVPVDGGPFYPPWEPLLQGADEVVAMSEFGRRVLQSGLAGRNIHLIPHGVDCDVFRPLEDRDQIRSHPRLAGKFIVGCVARNQPRKNIPALVRVFADLSSRHADLHLLLHMNPCDVGFDLVTLLHRYRLQGKADISDPATAPTRPVSDRLLNRIYNSMDVMALPTFGEGFGLPILESFAAGVPVIATDCSACTELVQGRGWLVRRAATLTAGVNLLDQAVVCESHLADCILEARKDPSGGREKGAVARRYAADFHWDVLSARWAKVLGCEL